MGLAVFVYAREVCSHGVYIGQGTELGFAKFGRDARAPCLPLGLRRLDLTLFDPPISLGLALGSVAGITQPPSNRGQAPHARHGAACPGAVTHGVDSQPSRGPRALPCITGSQASGGNRPTASQSPLLVQVLWAGRRPGCVDLWGQLILYYERIPCALWMLSSISGLHPLDVRSSTKGTPRPCPPCHHGAKSHSS